MNWLITGGCGFIGRALIRDLKKRGGHKVRVFDNLSVGTSDDLSGEGTVTDIDRGLDWNCDLALFVGDICDADSLARAAVGADVVVHLAANTGVGPSVQAPRADCETNVLGTLNALEACRAGSVKRFVFASSGAPLGVQIPPMHENMAPHPASPYGASKLAGEGYCSAYFQCFGIDSVVLRFGNVYGEGSTRKASVVAKFIKQALDGDPLEIFGDGNQTRDFIYVGDLVEAIQAAAITPGVGGEVFQIASAAETTIGELTEKLVGILSDLSGTQARVIHGSYRVGDVARNYSDTSKARSELGWQSKTSLDEGLRRTVAFFLDGRKSAMK